ncbi:hypothetical protein CkaCkLH20_12700 [Colletotrichum karsti]|uniref:Uncharacterized protein n=1 Tax=Colletotrichum karsti TaxID=1095194 RepID=A0A9P6HSA8_9PEZI|nr:uncharacterized protein CkaCkLH20_12700 [Colletotrichum karsti]KAF9869783.1 hypothetical protein CkaCkLH20_12700 [Colletotrichum karsti]
MWISMDAPFKAAVDSSNVCSSGLKFVKCPTWSGCCVVNDCKNRDGCPDAQTTGKKTATTIAAVAPPIAASPTPAKSDKYRSDTRLLQSTSKPPLTAGLTTYFSSEPTGGGAWFTDTKALPLPTAVSLTSGAAITQTSPAVASATAPTAEKKGSQLSGAEKGGIIGGVAGIILAIIVIWFMCGKQKRKLRSRSSIDSLDKTGVNGSVEEEDTPVPPTTANSVQQEQQSTSSYSRSENVFSPFGGRYEEPQSRFNRISEMNPNSKMMNHPVNPMSRDSIAPPPISSVVARSTTASPEVIARSATASPAIIARSATASPEFMSRLGTATPELQGPPQEAAIAELASPGLPKVVEIHSIRSGVKKYKPYRPNASSMYPVAETTPSYLTGTMNATQEERSSMKYVNSWKEWESTT